MNEIGTTYIIEGINPQPWSVSIRGKNGALDAYQNAVKEELADYDIEPWPVGVPVKLYFEFWRQLESVVDADRRRHRNQYADATNLQKALEDALQGVLFTNDRYVPDIHTRIKAQGADVEPKIVIRISPAVYD